MPTTIIIDSVTLTLKKYPEFPAGNPTATDITLFSDPVNGDLFKTTMDNFIANVLNVDGVTITGDGSSGNPLVSSGSPTTANNGLNMSTATNVQLGGTLLHNTLIATGAFTLEINTATSSVNPLKVVSSSGFAPAILSQGNYIAVEADGGLIGVSASAGSGGIGVSSIAIDGIPGDFVHSSTTGNTVGEGLRVKKSTSSPAVGEGIAINLALTTDNGSPLSDVLSNQLISKWTDATTASRVSQFIITGVNSAVSGDILTLNGNKSVQFNGYGSGSFTGTPVYNLQVDASGNIIETGVLSGGDTNFAITDLTATGNRTHTFAANTCEITFNSLAGASGFKLSSTSTAAASNNQKLFEIALSGASSNSGQSTYGIYASNTHTGSGVSRNYGIYAVADSALLNFGIYGTSSAGVGVYGFGSVIGVQGETSSTSGAGVTAINNSSSGVAFQSNSNDGISSIFVSNASTNNDVVNVVEIQRLSTSAGANGIGCKISFRNNGDTGAGALTLSNEIISKFTTITTGAEVSQMIITGYASATTVDILTLNSTKSVQFNGYGSGTFTGTATKWLAVDSSGNIIEQAPPSAGTGKYIPLAVISSPVTFSSGADNAVLTYAMPANTLNTNGQRIRFVAGMIHTLTSSTNDFRLAFTGGNAGSMDTTTSSQISYHAELIRRSSTEAEVVTFKTKTDGTCDIITKTVSGLDWTSIVTFHFYVSINGSGSVVTHMCALDFIDAP